jgi:uncharacterized protein (TIGR02145 family)
MRKHISIWIFPFALMGVLLILASSCKKKNDNTTPPITMTDYDGNVYQTVTIGSQVWIAENLKVTHYRNGDPIPHLTALPDWSDTYFGAYCEYGNILGNGTVYGKLYNFLTVSDPRNIAPAGWHIPTNDEWKVMTDKLGGEAIAGSKMKEKGTAHWSFPNNDATNESGFNALPGGYRDFSLDFLYVHASGFWWSYTNNGVIQCFIQLVNCDTPNVTKLTTNMNNGFSVRCVRD